VITSLSPFRLAHRLAVVIFNILGCFSWLCANTIVGAQLLTAVVRDLPAYGGVLILALAAFMVTLFGYKIIHKYQSWSWIPAFIVFVIVLGQFATSGVSIRLYPYTCRSDTYSIGDTGV
jgi:purine-cytosine permease-like protein